VDPVVPRQAAAVQALRVLLLLLELLVLLLLAAARRRFPRRPQLLQALPPCCVAQFLRLDWSSAAKQA
jgi:hypothetical protein